MGRVTIRITHTDGCVLEVRMPRRDFDRLYDTWVSVCLKGQGGLIRLPSPSGGLTPVPVDEIARIEPIDL